MFDKLTQKLAKKTGQVAQTAIQEAAEPVRTELTKAANNKVDLWSRVLRLGVLIFLFVDGTRRVVNDPGKHDSSPNQIVINNYIDSKPYNRQQKPYNHANGKKKG